MLYISCLSITYVTPSLDCISPCNLFTSLRSILCFNTIVDSCSKAQVLNKKRCLGYYENHVKHTWIFMRSCRHHKCVQKLTRMTCSKTIKKEITQPNNKNKQTQTYHTILLRNIGVHECPHLVTQLTCLSL